MPELPEVETVKRGLNELLSSPATIESVRTSSKALRFKYPRGFKKTLAGRRVSGLSRRAKYLLFELDQGLLINHLGMTGNWRSEGEFSETGHDHLELKLSSGLKLIYNDVRRFGYFDLLKKENWQSSKWFEHLGPEPVGPGDWSLDDFIATCKPRRTSIKAAIMNQQVVVGVGNIYASEALFLAGIPPQKKCSLISKQKYAALHGAIQKTLKSAIQSGGSTIKDFKNAGGSSGYFQTKLAVYDRSGELCRVCATPIRSETIAGRSTYWCPQCQK